MRITPQPLTICHSFRAQQADILFRVRSCEPVGLRSRGTLRHRAVFCAMNLLRFSELGLSPLECAVPRCPPLTPSMRRPIPVKSFLLFPDFFHFPRPAKPPLSPPFHPHASGSEVRSVPVGCSRFSRRCYL